MTIMLCPPSSLVLTVRSSDQNIMVRSTERKRSLSFPEPTFSRETPSRKRQRCSHRRVHFNYDENQVYPVESLVNLPKDDQRTLWVDQRDLQASLQGIRSSLQESSKSSFSHTVAHIYQACQTDSHSKNQQGIPASIAPSHLEQLALDGINNGPSGRGLESHVVESLALLRKQARRSHVRQVVSLSKHLSERARQESSDCSFSLPSVEECLQQIAAQSSSPSRKFAQTMGLGDALAAMYARESTVETNDTPQRRLPRNTSFSTRAA